MKKSDYMMAFFTIIAIFILVFPPTSNAFFGFTDAYPLIGGFLKFFLFASFGDVISHRIRNHNYAVPGLLYKAIVWGVIGIIIVFVFHIFSMGILSLQDEGLLPFAGNMFAFALFTSVFMNMIFAPTMMLFHRITDHYIEHRIVSDQHQIKTTIDMVDYRGFLSFVVFKTIPLFWIPAHTITFMLSDTYRVFFASMLGIALGLLLGIAKPKVKQGG